jgi:MATE family multidrug resistance protein
MSLCALTFILLRGQLPHFFINDPNVESIATSLLLICAFFQLSDGVQVVGLGALRGIGDVRIPTLIAMLAYWIIGIPSGYLFAFTFGMNTEGIWYGLFLGLMVASVLLFVRFNNKSRMLIKDKKQVPSVAD